MSSFQGTKLDTVTSLIRVNEIPMWTWTWVTGEYFINCCTASHWQFHHAMPWTLICTLQSQVFFRKLKKRNTEPIWTTKQFVFKAYGPTQLSRELCQLSFQHNSSNAAGSIKVGCAASVLWYADTGRGLLPIPSHSFPRSKSGTDAGCGPPCTEFWNGPDICNIWHVSKSGMFKCFK